MKFIDLSYKEFRTTDIARCLKARYTAAPTNHACEDSGVLVYSGGGTILDWIKHNLPIKMSKPYGTERKNMSIQSYGDKEANCLQSHYAKGLSTGDTAVMQINVVGNKNPSGHGQGGCVYDSDDILGALNVAKSTAPNIAVRETPATEYAEKQNGLAIKEATKQGYAIAEVGDSVNIGQPSSTTRRGRVGKGVANTLTCSDQMAVVVEKNVDILGNYSPSGHEASRVVHPAGIAPTVKENHGTVTATIVDDQGRTKKKLEPKEVCPTLRAQSHGNEPKVINNNIRIRKLTPKECWRLQGFPDEYFDKAKAAGVSDSQLYKQAGNAVTVNVARAIGERLKEIEDDEKER